jgi:hypothetical protein
MNELTKPIRKQIVDAYLLSFDPGDVGRVVKGETCDNAIAVITGIEVLKDRKISDEIDAAILKRRIQPDALKIDAYKLSRLDSDGRVKVKALEILGKWMKLEDAPSLNMFNLTWQSMVEAARNNKRMNDARIVEVKVEALPDGGGN